MYIMHNQRQWWVETELCPQVDQPWQVCHTPTFRDALPNQATKTSRLSTGAIDTNSFRLNWRLESKPDRRLY